MVNLHAMIKVRVEDGEMFETTVGRVLVYDTFHKVLHLNGSIMHLRRKILLNLLNVYIVNLVKKNGNVLG